MGTLEKLKLLFFVNLILRDGHHLACFWIYICGALISSEGIAYICRIRLVNLGIGCGQELREYFMIWNMFKIYG